MANPQNFTVEISKATSNNKFFAKLVGKRVVQLPGGLTNTSKKTYYMFTDTQLALNSNLSLDTDSLITRTEDWTNPNDGVVYPLEYIIGVK